ncbi:alpha/beta fold hydrolase [Burkholderia cenocepacia]|uniref:alpha/beta fold hydrolase n=1 Tax=Burkholderia cenocepacia TaxID=95486 RepID=UPI00158D0931|nr:alpha/beta hydrolase [Burkholderia cenocepacia]
MPERFDISVTLERPIALAERQDDAAARFETLEGCGHFPTLERPSICTDIARRWLIEQVIGSPVGGIAAT